MNKLRKHYMTLLELLVSMSIFSVVMVILASMVYSVSQVTRKQQQKTDMYRDQRILMSVVTQDLQSLVVSNDTGKEISCAFQIAPVISGDYEYVGAFISNSGLGVTPGTDTSFLTEVVYCRQITNGGTPITKDTPLYRCIVTASPANTGGGAWNFIGNPAGWGNAFGDASVSTAIVAKGVSRFNMVALDATGAAMVGPRTTAPVVVSVMAEFQDLGDTTGNEETAHAARLFTKRIFTKRGE